MVFSFRVVERERERESEVLLIDGRISSDGFVRHGPEEFVKSLGTWQTTEFPVKENKKNS